MKEEGATPSYYLSPPMALAASPSHFGFGIVVRQQNQTYVEDRRLLTKAWSISHGEFLLPKEGAKFRNMAGPSISPSKDVWRDGMCPLSDRPTDRPTDRHQCNGTFFLSFFLSLPPVLSFRCQRQTASSHSVSQSVGRREIIIGRPRPLLFLH